MSRYRNFFRIEYPPESRPVFEYNGEHHEVINVSEQGAKISLSKVDDSLKVGTTLGGTIHFKHPNEDRRLCSISGMILRKDPKTIALQLSEGVPWKQIMDEQRFLLKAYGTIKQAKRPNRDPQED